MRHLYIFNERSNAAIYGVGTYLRQIVPIALKSRQLLSVTVVELLSGEVKEYTVEEKQGYKVVRIPPGVISSCRMRIEDYYRAVWHLIRKQILETGRDKLLFHFNYPTEKTIARLARKDFPGCLCLLVVHYQEWGLYLHGDKGYFTEVLQKKERNELEKVVYASYRNDVEAYKDMDRVVCLSRFTYSLLKDYYEVPERCLFYQPNVLRADKLETSEKGKKKTEIKKGFHLERNKKVLLFVGRIDRLKGLFVLIEAFRLLLESDPDYRLFVVGGGDYESCFPACRDLWSRIFFTGVMDKEELFDLYRIADVGILPSFFEQCSYVAIEMMMFGIPLVGSDAPGMDEITHERLKVRLYGHKEEKSGSCQEDTAGIARELARKIQEAYHDRAYYSRQMKMFYKQHFTVERLDLDDMYAFTNTLLL